MPESLLVLLKWCLVALLYLFFAAVLRTVWADLRPGTVPAGAPAPTSAAPKRATPDKARTRKQKSARATLLEVEATDAPGVAVGATWSLESEVTIGRTGGCHIALDDGFVSGLHARVFPTADGASVDDLGSTNGTKVNGERITATRVLRPGDRIQVGSTALVVR